MELEGQVAIITGAGRGIGRATVLELARMGSDIVVAELDRENAERTAAEVRALGCRALVVPTDVTSRKDLGAMVEQTRAEFGRIDTLVKHFCPECGSSIAEEPGTRTGMIILNVGTIDDPTVAKASREIFRDDALPWVAVHGEIPRFAKRPG